MLRTVWFFIWLFFYLLGLVPRRVRVWWLSHRGRWDERQTLVDCTVLNWARAALRNSGVRLTVTGRENLPAAGQPVVFVANHQSFLDIPVVLCGLGRAFPLMSKNGMKRLPFIRGWMKTLGCVIVKPGDIATQAAALRHSKELLHQGKQLFIFPEGRRSGGRGMLPFQPAAFSVACREKVPLVPIAIDGCHLNFDCARWRIRDTDVVLHILPPIDTRGLGAAQRRMLPKRVEETIQAKLNEAGAGGELPSTA